MVQDAEFLCKRCR